MKHNSTTLLHTAFTQEEKIILDEAFSFVENYNGDNFLIDISSFIFQILKTDYVIIGNLESPSTKFIKSEILLYKGRHLANDYFNLESTPFAMALENDFSYYPSRLLDIFPNAKNFYKLHVDSFLGITLYNSKEQKIGMVALMHNNIIERGGFVEALLNAIIPQIETELIHSIHHQEVSI